MTSIRPTQRLKEALELEYPSPKTIVKSVDIIKPPEVIRRRRFLSPSLYFTILGIFT
jgi:hypothetical protein